MDNHYTNLIKKDKTKDTYLNKPKPKKPEEEELKKLKVKTSSIFQTKNKIKSPKYKKPKKKKFKNYFNNYKMGSFKDNPGGGFKMF